MLNMTRWSAAALAGHSWFTMADWEDLKECREYVLNYTLMYLIYNLNRSFNYIKYKELHYKKLLSYLLQSAKNELWKLFIIIEIVF